MAVATRIRSLSMGALTAAHPRQPLRLGRLGIEWTPNVHRDAMLLVGLIVGVAIATRGSFAPADVMTYWAAGTSDRLYPEHWQEVELGYLFYPPPVAQASALLQPIGWSAFAILLTVATFWAMWFSVRTLAIPLLLLGVPHYLEIGPAEPAVFLDYALLGNLQWLLVAASLVAFRRPSLFAALLLTKVATAVGWWWHPLRGDWPAASRPVIVTGAVMFASFVAAPELWFAFARFVTGNYTTADPPLPTFFVPIGIRLPTAILLVFWGARTGRSWTIPVATGWALPAMYGMSFLLFWVAAAVAYRDGRLPNLPPMPPLFRRRAAAG